MTDLGPEIDRIMDQASESLVANRYLECEQLCTAAVVKARAAGDFERLARIMLPLQEARRQRRQIAEDAGTIILNGLRREPDAVLDEHPRGCLLLTDPPYAAADGDALREAARRRELFVEVLVMDDAALTAAFCAAMENAGDALLASLDAHADPVKQVDAILAQLDRVGDHEIAHQRLADAARRAARQ